MNNLKEHLAIIICVIVIVIAGYSTGIVRSFDDIPHIIDNLSLTISAKTGYEAPAKRFTQSQNQKYRTQPITNDMFAASTDKRVWTNILYANRKVIFYTNPSKNDDFDTFINDYLSKNNLESYFLNASMEYSTFRRVRTGLSGPEKMCNSLQECNEYRKKAANYNNLSMLMERCAKAFCIFNPVKKEYVYLNNKNSSEASQMLNALKNW